MKQRDFTEAEQDEWRLFEDMLVFLEGGAPKQQQPLALELFPDRYRRLCHHLSLARERQYSPHLVERLNDLVLRGHQQLYRRKTDLKTAVIAFLVSGFPELVRRQWRYCMVAAAVFYGPLALIYLLVSAYPEMIYSVIDPEMVATIEGMYDPAAEHFGRPREADGDFAAFGFYIYNNIGISFRTFATGMAWGLGSVFFLAYNGVFLGSLAAHLVELNFTETFFPFIIGHGAFELTAIVLSGAAGMRLGYALLAPGRLTRAQALRESAAVAVRLMYGVIVMLLIAAFIEAFWSSSVLVESGLKYAVGGALWLFILVYFTMMGRRGAA